jgi:histone deacetylase 11
MIIDLDAHQGNGFESILKDDKRISIFDMYNFENYPMDFEAGKYIRFRIACPWGTDTADYLSLLKLKLEADLKELSKHNEKPDLIIYNAGSDVYENDRLGGLKVSKEGIKERDELVFAKAQELHVPILMVLSGGYSPESAEMVADSIANVIEARTTSENANNC